jgi:Mn2+/Fe2+ NRAMP family transporter
VLAGIGMNYIGLDPIKALFYTAVINGLVAPPLLALIVLLGSDRRFMGNRVSGRLSRTLTWLATALMSAAAAALIATSLLPH